MSAENNNSAYDLSLFEPIHKTKNQKSESNKEKTKSNDDNIISLDPDIITKSQRRKKNPIMILGISLLTIIAAVVSATIVQSNVLLNELNEQILEANEKIEEQTNLAAQYQLKVDSKLSTDVIQEYAENELGMVQAQSSQKNFISLSDGDYAEVIREDDTENILETIAEAFTGLWS